MKPRHIFSAALFLILVLGTFLRFTRITSVPPSLSHDETAIAYNAYSILQTGKDEYGVSYPLLFRSFDDYKLPGMVYATVPSVAIFGNTAMGARFPSAFLGSLTILIVYLLVYEIFRAARAHVGKTTLHAPSLYGAAAAFFFAISPWHINFSRQLFESNGALFFLSVAIYALLLSLRNIRFLMLAAALMGVSVYFYYSVRLVIPCILLAYWIINRKHIAQNIPIALLSLCIGIVTLIPIGRQMFTPGGLERISIVSIVNDPNYLRWKDTFIDIYAKQPTIVRKVIFNRKTALGMAILDNYWKNVAPLHVFASGTSTYGLQHPFEIPFIFVGILFLITIPAPGKWLLIVWFLAALLPGALSTNQPNALRTLLAAPFFSICSGLGAISIMTSIGERKRLWYGIVPFGLLLVFFFYAFYQSYFVVNPTRNALAFGDGYEQMIAYVRNHESLYDRVVISGYYWRPYIFMLYWNKVDPAAYQREGSRSGWGKYLFTGAEWDNNDIFLYNSSYDPRKLIVSTPEHTLFILARPEFERNKERYQYIETISGRNEPAVFVAATAK